MCYEAEGIACAKAQGREQAWSIQGTVWNSLARNEPGNMVGEETKGGLRLDSKGL